MNFLHTWHPDPVLLAIGGFEIHWYGLMLALGAVAGYALILRQARRAQLDTKHLNDLFVWLIIFGLLGARLYHVLNEWEYYLERPDQILAVWNGGLAIHGAIIAGLLVLWRYAKRHQLSFLNLADVLVPGLAIGQAIGRWGNYFNQELFGQPTGLPWGIPIDLANRPASYRMFEYFHPTFLYESLGNALIALVLVRVLRSQHRPGTVMGAYVILYSTLRILTESLRIDRTPVIAGIRLPILVSGAIILATVLTVIWLQRRTPSHANRA